MRYAINTVTYIHANSDEEARSKVFKLITATLEPMGIQMDVGESREFAKSKPVREWCSEHGYQDFEDRPYGVMCSGCIAERQKDESNGT